MRPADAAAQLVQLGEAEALGMFDHHDGRVRHVDADLHDGGRDENARAAILEGEHGLVLLAARHLAVDEANACAEDGGRVSWRSCAGGEVDLV